MVSWTVVISTFLYARESWVLYRINICKLKISIKWNFVKSWGTHGRTGSRARKFSSSAQKMKSLETIITRHRFRCCRTPCPNARQPPTRPNPLLRARICQETTWNPTLSIQGWAKKHLAEDRSPSAQLEDRRCRKKQRPLLREKINCQTEVTERTNCWRAVHEKTSSFEKKKNRR